MPSTEIGGVGTEGIPFETVAAEGLHARLKEVQVRTDDEQRALEAQLRQAVQRAQSCDDPEVRRCIQQLLLAVQEYVGGTEAAQETLLCLAGEALALLTAPSVVSRPAAPPQQRQVEAFCAPQLGGAEVVPSLPEPSGETSAEHHLIDAYNQSDMGRLEVRGRRGRLLRRRARATVA